MSRDDSLLNTGATSVSKAKTAREETREQNKRKRYNLLPAGEIVRAEIQKEIDAIQNIDYLNIEKMLTEGQLRAELMARKKTIERLKAVMTRLDNLLRDNKE